MPQQFLLRYRFTHISSIDFLTIIYYFYRVKGYFYMIFLHKNFTAALRLTGLCAAHAKGKGQAVFVQVVQVQFAQRSKAVRRGVLRDFSIP